MRGWFGPKQFGVGMAARSWQGWLATAVLLGVLIGSRYVPYRTIGLPQWSRLVVVMAAVALYLILAGLKYQRD